MFTVTKTSTRTSVDVPFLSSPDAPQITPEFKSYFKQTYIDTGKVINHYTEMSVDSLTETSHTQWIDEAAFQEFKADPMAITDFLSVRSAYQTETGTVDGPSSTSTSLV